MFDFRSLRHTKKRRSDGPWGVVGCCRAWAGRRCFRVRLSRGGRLFLRRCFGLFVIRSTEKFPPHADSGACADQAQREAWAPLPAFVPRLSDPTGERGLKKRQRRSRRGRPTAMFPWHPATAITCCKVQVHADVHRGGWEVWRALSRPLQLASVRARHLGSWLC